MLTFSLKLEKGSFHVADLPRTGKKCTAIIKAREGRAKVLFLKEMLYAVRCLKSNEDMILALAGQFKQLSHEPEKFR